MTKPVIALSHPMFAGLVGMLSGQYEVLKVWDHADPMDFARGPGQRLQALVAAGEHGFAPAFYEAMPKLELVACVSVGYDAYDPAFLQSRGVAMSHADSLNADDVADHAVGSALAAWRIIAAGDRLLRSGGWTPSYRGPLRPSLKGKKVGIVGLGAIGLAIAKRLEAFGVEIAWWGPRAKADAPYPFVPSLLDLAKASDILFVACRADASNTGLISKAVIEALGPEGLLVNVARGSVLDEDAAIAALKSGALGMAALDVFIEEPTPPSRWADVPNTVLTPHTAGSTSGVIPAMIGQMVENLRRHFAGEPLLSPVKID
jgi:lactate dehydrogenase-like 2-hydroxyacid dehydrogenase